MQPNTSGTVTSHLGRMVAWLSANRVLTVLYYLAVMLGLVVLYGRGDTSTVGFIYQAF